MTNRFLRALTVCSLLFAEKFTHAQDLPGSGDTTALPNVRVTAFEHSTRLREVAAPVSYLNAPALQRFGAASIVQAVNTVAGVRMEERSPGSYRFNIRGSSLRSPFGVRNVKIYLNDLPYTDPAGTTYLNQLGSYSVRSMEIIKGPGSSVYGAGTGGVLLVNSLAAGDAPGVSAEYTAGSFGLHTVNVNATTGNENALSSLSYQHQTSDGYRQQSGLRRDVFMWSGSYRFEKERMLKTTFLYGDLFYETPGALTAAEYNADPKAARPGGGGFPGAVAARASIRQKTFLAGASYEQQLIGSLHNKTALYGMFTELTNPNLRGYEKSSLPHFGGRTVLTLEKNLGTSVLNLDAGAEWQEGLGRVSIHKNNGGNADSLRTTDEINTSQKFVFAQAVLNVGSAWTVSAGASWNWSDLQFTRFTPATLGQQKRRFSNEIGPRVALMRKFEKTALYASLSKGFSPPTTSELLPTGGAINLGLDAETGTSYDLGFKGMGPGGLHFDANLFLFRLNNTIVQRRDAGGGDFFDNAGKTDQKGIEASLTYPLLKQNFSWIQNSQAWIGYTYNRFRYDEFKQLTSDFSGNRLPGISPHTLSAGYDLVASNGWLFTINYYFSDRLPLNDANTAYATDYHLLGGRIGYQRNVGSWKLRLIGGVENLLDEQYSLGNDINGFGGRYFNAAPGRNYYVSLLVDWRKKG